MKPKRDTNARNSCGKVRAFFMGYGRFDAGNLQKTAECSMINCIGRWKRLPTGGNVRIGTVFFLKDKEKQS